jgi:hypothetical protein
MAYTDLVFDAPPGPKAGRLVRIEDESGKIIRPGEWIERRGGYWALRLAAPTQLNADLLAALRKALEFLEDDRIGTINYMEGPAFYEDRDKTATVVRAAIAKADQPP